MSVGLTYEDVEYHVYSLPRIVREHLALGPHPEPDEALGAGADLCRVCDALGEGGANLPKASLDRERLHAHELWAWHDLGACDLFDFAEAAGIDVDNLELLGNADLVGQLLGALSYARCCAIYATASASIRKLP